MIVDKNGPAFPLPDTPEFEGSLGIPLRLEIASRCMASLLSGRFCDVGTDEPYTVLCLGDHLMWNDTANGPRLAATLALEAADALIAAHNDTCGL